jgi:PAS domain-containing protein
MATTLIVDATGLILMWSRDAETLLGYSEVEAVRKIHRADHPAAFARAAQYGLRPLRTDGY